MNAGSPILLSDPDDPRLALYRDVRDADLRGAHGVFLVESTACIERWLEAVARRRRGEALPPPMEVHSLLLSPEAHERLRPAIDAAAAAPVYLLPRERIERLSGFDHHHGALALGRRAHDCTLDRLLAALPGDDRRSSTAAADPSTRFVAPGTRELPRPCVLLATDGVVHVDNMGSIFRNAHAFGAAGLLLSRDSADPLVRKTIRISMGRVFSVPWAVSGSLASDLEALRRRAFRLIVAEDAPAANEVTECTFGDRCVVVFGAEGRGVTPALLGAADEVCRIDTRPGVSLNVAVASAIVLHEAIRARRRRGPGRQ